MKTERNKEATLVRIFYIKTYRALTRVIFMAPDVRTKFLFSSSAFA